MVAIEKFTISIIALIVLLLLAISLDFITGDSKKLTGDLVYKSYTPSSVNTGFTTGGNLAVTSKGERYVIMVNVDGEVFNVRTCSDVFYSVSEGDEVWFNATFGGISGSCLSSYK